MTGEGNEGTANGHAKKDEESSWVLEAEASKEEEDSSSLKAAGSKEKGKGGSKSHGSDAAADDSDKNSIHDDVPLSFPQRVSCCMCCLICLVCCLLRCDRIGDARIIHHGLRIVK
jgi:hypothetical protein